MIINTQVPNPSGLLLLCAARREKWTAVVSIVISLG
jgi:hypothetical protein